MTMLLIDPSLRRARRARFAVAALMLFTVAVIATFARGLTGGARPAPSLPQARRPAPKGRNRPLLGRRPAAGRNARIVRERSHTPIAPRAERVLPVIAFLEASAAGALDSLERHADRIAELAVTGLLIGEDGELIDRIDARSLAAAQRHRLELALVVQDLAPDGGPWRPENVHALGDARVRRHFASALAERCQAEHAGGVHLDFEELDDEDWDAVARTAAELRTLGVRVTVDVPAELPEATLARLGRAANRVLVMAYDEHDSEAPPGPIASDGFVVDALERAAPLVPAGALVAGLGIYGYDWQPGAPGDPLSFADAHAAAREAGVTPEWDAPSGNSHARIVDDEGAHEMWWVDAAAVFDQARIAQRAGAGAIALWRLGGEDPGVWDALTGRGADALATVAPEPRVDNRGDGPFLSLALAQEAGERRVVADGERVSGERWLRSPAPFVVRRAGIVPGKVALTFDDGPDPRYTPAILDVLQREHAPASFFVVGMNAARAPELVTRAYAEGHEIGNHSFTHPDVAAIGDLRLRLELEATSRLVETLLGRRPLLYRPPSLADIEPRTLEGAAAFARAGSLGYLVVDADVDPRDWESPSADELTARVLDETGGGGVVLLHDSGGDRSTTVAALPRIIGGLRARGLEIVPLAELVGKRRDQVMPPAPPRVMVMGASTAVFRGAGAAVGLTGLALLAGGALIALRLLVVLGCALASERRRARRRSGPLPSVTAVVPAYNEAQVIERTVQSLLDSDVPVDVMVVDDGSRDGTAEVIARRFGRDPRVALVRQPNRGKAAALRTAFRLARSEIVVALDGDTLFRRDTVRLLCEPFADPRVAAVAGTAEVGNLENALTACQALEYCVQQELERRAWDAFAALPVVPGAVGAWRRRAVLAAGGFASDTLAEDADLAMALCRGGWRVVHQPAARAHTEAPAQVRGLCKQRVRWCFGVLQSLWKHRRALCERRAGAFGRVVLPMMLLYQVLLPLLAPLALAALAAAVAAGHLRPALITSALLFAADLAQAALAVRLARRSGGAPPRRWLAWLIASRVVYRPLLMVVTWRSLARVLDGIPLGWNKLQRRGTVRAMEEP
jgi:cellulose synthase/poly-beta-1,6-N-acetylglucosamine synthase-like glycosyltransferase/peptidoglycan/xylan/chitin deacetylase (PgdA/CDA1 family)/spore germination protein YaaH